MSAPFLTISSGRREDQWNGPDGAFPALLAEISDPQTAIAKTGENAGQEYTYITWTFALDHDEFQGTLDYRTSDKTGPKSKIYGLLTALSGGKALKPGLGLSKEQLIGKPCIVTVATNPDNDYPFIANISAMPAVSSGKRPAPKVNEALAESAKDDDADLPF